MRRQTDRLFFVAFFKVSNYGKGEKSRLNRKIEGHFLLKFQHFLCIIIIGGKIMKKGKVLDNWSDSFDGAAIYSLVDDNGKRYIGQTIKLQNRLHTHMRELNRLYRDNEAPTTEGKKLADAARDGVQFTVDILKKFRWYEVTVNNLRKWESYYLEKFGGVHNTYNTAPVPYPNHLHDDDDAVILTFDADNLLYEHLNNKDNIQGYLKSLIRSDMKRGE